MEAEHASNQSLQLWDVYMHALKAVTTRLSKALGSLGALITRRPWHVFIATSLFALVLSVGCIRLETEEDSEELWVPQDTSVMKQQDYVDLNFPSTDELVLMIVESEDGESGNAITLDLTSDFHDLQQQVLEVEVAWEGVYRRDIASGREATWAGGPVKYADICLRDAIGECKYGAYLKFWNNSKAWYVESVGAEPMDPESGDPQQLVVDVNAQTFPGGKEVVPSTVFGGRVDLDGAGRIVGCRVLRQTWQLDRQVTKRLREDWANALEDWMLSHGSNTYTTPNARARVYFKHPVSMNNAISESISGDIPLLFASIAIIAVVSVLVLSKWDCIRTRSSLGVAGVGIVALSILSGYGLVMWFGVPFTSLQGVLPFILLGIGVDDMFVLVRALEEVDLRFPGLPEEERFRRMMETGGVSITVTSVTDLAAFLLGSFTRIPAIRWFCWYAGVAIFIDYLFQITLFICMFVWTERRIAAARPDFTCCLPGARAATGSPGDGTGQAAPANAEAAACKEPDSASSGSAPPDSSVISSPSEDLQSRTSTCLTPCMSLQVEAERQWSGGSETPKLPATGAVLEAVRVQAVAASAPPPAAAAAAAAADKAGRSWVQQFLDDTYVPILLHPVSKATILLLFAALAAAGIVGITRLQEGLELAQLAPDDHYLKDYDGIDKATFEQGSGRPTAIYFREMDHTDPELQLKFLQARQYMLDHGDYIDKQQSPNRQWLSELVAFIQDGSSSCSDADLRAGNVTETLADGSERTVPVWMLAAPDKFYTCLDELLDSEQGRTYLDDLAFTAIPELCPGPQSGTRGCLQASLMRLQHTPKRGQRSYNRKAMDDKDRLMEQVNGRIFPGQNTASDAGEVCFLYAPYYVYWQPDQIMLEELLMNLGLALLGIAIINLVLLVHPWAAALMVLAVATVDAALFAWMWAFGIELNSVSVVNLVMAVGLAVDYSVHITHKFLTKHGTRNERMKAAMGEMGAAVLVGALTTMLGMAPLPGSTSYISRTFSSLIFAIVLFGILVGFMLVPVVLSLIGPGRCIEEELDRYTSHPTVDGTEPKPTSDPMTDRDAPPTTTVAEDPLDSFWLDPNVVR